MCPRPEPGKVHTRGPITAAGSSLTALLGSVHRGPRYEPVRVSSVSEFEAAYGGVSESRLGRAFSDLLANGGRGALVVRANDAGPGLAALSDVRDDFQLLVIDPELVQARTLGEADALCEERRAFLVADATEEGTVPAALLKAGARNAAVYFPALCDEDGSLRPVAPAVAGIYARNDLTRGVWRLPGGSTAVLQRGAQVAVRLTDRDLEHLAARNVNALRTMPDGAVMIWGNRTVSDDPAWRFVNVRRFLLFVEHSIEQGLQWVVSEPNDEALWTAVRSDVTTFLTGLWRRGALPGERPRDAFSVRCDGSTMTQEDIDAGRLVVLVGVATEQPAEFVVVRIGVRTGA